jgi:hypothetical protein
MSKDSPKATPLEKAQDWIADHGDESLDLKALKAAVAAAEKANTATVDAATKLGLALEARKASFKALKDALKAAKAGRKAKKTPAPKGSAPLPGAGPVPGKVAPAKRAPARKAAPPKTPAQP